MAVCQSLRRADYIKRAAQYRSEITPKQQIRHCNYTAYAFKTYWAGAESGVTPIDQSDNKSKIRGVRLWECPYKVCTGAQTGF